MKREIKREIKFRIYDQHSKVMEGPEGLKVTMHDGPYWRELIDLTLKDLETK